MRVSAEDRERLSKKMNKQKINQEEFNVVFNESMNAILQNNLPGSQISDGSQQPPNNIWNIPQNNTNNRDNQSSQNGMNQPIIRNDSDSDDNWWYATFGEFAVKIISLS